VEFPKIHNIREILTLVRTVDSGLADALQHASALTPYGVETRYPGELPDPSRREAEAALAAAQDVANAVKSRLQTDEPGTPKHRGVG
jgi:HEPN domain-containing protein